MRAMPMSTPSLLTQAGASGRAMARRNEHVRRLPAHSIDRRAFSAPPLPGHLVILTKLSPPFFSPPCAIFAYYLWGWLCDLCGRRYVIPGFVLPASILLVILGHLDSPSGLFWVGLVLNFLITGSFGVGLGYNTELFPTQIRGTAVGVAFTLGSAAAASSPAIVGWIATSHSIAAALPLLALSFFLLVPMFLFVAQETTRKELADFVGQRT